MAKKKKRNRGKSKAKKAAEAAVEGQTAHTTLSPEEIAHAGVRGDVQCPDDEAIAAMSINDRNKALAQKQAVTKTIIPGQAVPKDMRDALQTALEEIEAEDIAAGRNTGSVAEDDQPFANAPPSSTSDQRVLLRQKRMLHRMRKKQRENKEREKLALIDPADPSSQKATHPPNFGVVCVAVAVYARWRVPRPPRPRKACC